MNQDHLPICDYEGSDYQTAFWDEGGRDYEDQVEAVALKRLLAESGDLLLEIGAGAGRNTSRYSGYEHIVLLDYSRTQLIKAKERLGNSDRYTYVAADTYNLPFVGELFSGATMIRTMHHLVEPVRALRQIREVLQSGGTFILEYANKFNLKSIIRYTFRRQDWSPFSLDPVEFADLNFDFHPQAVRNWLQDCGFSIDRQLTVSHFRINILKRYIPLKLLVSMDSVMQLTGDFWQLTPSVFVRSTAVGDTPRIKKSTFFRCAECGHSPLTKEEFGFECPSCSRCWSYKNGIYDFRNPISG